MTTTRQSKMRPVFTRLHAATLRPATTRDDLADCLRAADAFPDRRRLAEGAVYTAALRRWTMLTGASWKADQQAPADSTWGGQSDHRPRFRIYAEPTPVNGITGSWACSCGASGTSVDPEAVHTAHVAAQAVTA